MTNAPWLDEMVALVGVKELKGAKHEPRILEFAKLCGHDDIDDDETPWCAFSIGACLVKSGLPTAMPIALNGLARSYLKYGTSCEAKPGAIAIWPRGKSPAKGHVNIVEEVHADGSITCVGGNQTDKTGKSGGVVSRVTYTPAQVKNALGFRWPPEKPTVKTVVKTAATSRRFMASVTSFAMLIGGAVMDGMQYLANGIALAVDSLPGMTNDAQQFMSSSEQVMSWMGIPWGKVSLGMAAVSILYFGGRHLSEKVRAPWAA